ncbi:MAG: DUF2277 domain-containing protein [Saprospiraceae bacterium]|nr:DUF2277 domain-containing protein [Saprospiraceae bacterium]
MCRNIRTLHNYDPPATKEEIYASALQFVRKISGSTKPSKANEELFYQSVTDVCGIVEHLLDGLETTAQPRNREVEKAKARERNLKRFGV